MSLTLMNRSRSDQQFGQMRGGSVQLINSGGSISRMIPQGARMGGQYQCINPGDVSIQISTGSPDMGFTSNPMTYRVAESDSK